MNTTNNLLVVIIILLLLIFIIVTTSLLINTIPNNDDNNIKDTTCNFACKLQNMGHGAYIYNTKEWENLNQDIFYSVSIGEHTTKEDAIATLKTVKPDVPNAYVKYTGEYKY